VSSDPAAETLAPGRPAANAAPPSTPNFNRSRLDVVMFVSLSPCLPGIRLLQDTLGLK
jgi:hypothetical protein